MEMEKESKRTRMVSNRSLPYTVNKNMLDAAMISKGYNSGVMGGFIGLNRMSYDNKRNGKVPFQANEIREIARVLDLSMEQVNVIFFDGKLHGRKIFVEMLEKVISEASLLG